MADSYRNPFTTDRNVDTIDTDVVQKRLSIEEEVAKETARLKIQLVKAGYNLESDEAKKVVADQQKYLKKLKEKQRKDEKSLFKADLKQQNKEREKQEAENRKKSLKYLIEEFAERKKLGEEITKEERQQKRALQKEV